jgi:hypothetical protein
MPFPKGSLHTNTLSHICALLWSHICQNYSRHIHSQLHVILQPSCLQNKSRIFTQLNCHVCCTMRTLGWTTGAFSHSSPSVQCINQRLYAVQVPVRLCCNIWALHHPTIPAAA